MKIEKLISKAESFFDAEDRKLKEKISCAKHILKKLRKREKKLNIKLQENRGDPDRIKTEMLLIHAQRKKGITKLKEFEKTKREKKAKKVTSIA